MHLTIAPLSHFYLSLISLPCSKLVSLLHRLIGLYAATAGTVYVGAKLIATNMRIEDNPEARQRQHQRRL